ncbi:regulator of G-protein signaling 7-like isoform X2 [Rhopilema esculentum]|uniref:regulator of G-protein signaling 7-like isoform X2 n=1 Tax=Rhopilema esculentum TaxID=499914 RepID=UPI0031E0C956
MANIPASQVDSQLAIALEKIEEVVVAMLSETSGVPLQTIKSFRTVLTNVCSGADLISWLMKHLRIYSREEALCLARTIASHGYIHTVPDCKLTAKDDATSHRFQNQYFWPSACNEVTVHNYAVYLCKRMISNKSRLQLDEWELEVFTKLRRQLEKRWDLIYMEADAKYKVEKKKDKAQKRINETQERAFWNLHRPPPGAKNVLEADIKKVRMDENGFGPRHGKARVSLQLAAAKMSEDALNHALDDAMRKVDDIRQLFLKQRIKSSSAAESLIKKTSQYATYDPLLTTPTPSNPWISDDNAFWQDNNKKAVPPQKQVRRWCFSLDDLLSDPQGTMIFLKYLEKEFSAENLRFWLAVEEFKYCPLSSINSTAKEILRDYIGNNAVYPINVDQRAVELVNERMLAPNHSTFDPAQNQIYTLMKTDTYKRFLKSENYLSLLRDTPQSRRGRSRTAQWFV